MSDLKTRLVFCADDLRDPEDEEDFDDRDGKTLAHYLFEQLPKYGFETLDIIEEDWGWEVEVRNPSFSLYVGCGCAGEDDGWFNCFTIPDKERVWRWFRPIDTRPVLNPLRDALEKIIRAHPGSTNVRWVQM